MSLCFNQIVVIMNFQGRRYRFMDLKERFIENTEGVYLTLQHQKKAVPTEGGALYLFLNNFPNFVLLFYQRSKQV